MVCLKPGVHYKTKVFVLCLDNNPLGMLILLRRQRHRSQTKYVEKIEECCWAKSHIRERVEKEACQNIIA